MLISLAVGARSCCVTSLSECWEPIISAHQASRYCWIHLRRPALKSACSFTERLHFEQINARQCTAVVVAGQRQVQISEGRYRPQSTSCVSRKYKYNPTKTMTMSHHDHPPSRSIFHSSRLQISNSATTTSQKPSQASHTVKPSCTNHLPPLPRSIMPDRLQSNLSTI